MKPENPKPRRRKKEPSVPVATRLTPKEKRSLARLAALANQSFAGYVAAILRERLESRPSQVALAREMLKGLPGPEQACFCAAGRSQRKLFKDCCQGSLLAFLGREFPGVGREELFTIYANLRIAS
ncbi:MAG TPA: hypothetical protein VM008_11950 [Phycisphaerae bacterium]|nr:hypothetical protein [Phycisphaerae bacterium]